MQTVTWPIVVVELAANDLPLAANVERARQRERDRKRRGPVWSQPVSPVTTA
jgi:hypothetical protein